MDDYDVDPLPPRSSYRPSAPQGRTSRSSSVSSSVSAESSSRQSQPWFLKRRVLSVDEYAVELRRGAAAREELAREYGGRAVPIPVPLEEGEREAAYERRFVQWLLNEKGLTLAQLADGPVNMNRERSLRISFAKSHVKNRSSRGEPDLGPLVSKRGRCDDYRDAYGHSDSKRPRDHHGPSEANRLLRKRVIPFAQFKQEQERYGGRQLTDSERLELYGTTTVPITVPLFEGETFEDYEREFQRHLKTVSMDVSRLPNEPNTERSLRLLFAQNRLKQGSGRIPGGGMKPKETSQQRSTDPSHEAEKPKRELDGRTEAAKSVPTSSGHATAPSINPSESEARKDTAKPSNPEASTPFQFPTRCSARGSSSGKPRDVDVPALLDCGCRRCLLESTSRLISRVGKLEESIAARSTAATAEENHVMDLTRDHDAMCSTDSSSTKRVDVARMLHITALVRERRQQRQNNQSEATANVEDPIEHQLLAQYDEINNRVIANQQTLEYTAAQLQQAPLDQIEVTSHNQLENRELEALVNEEMGHRNAALAMLLVYMSRHSPQDLEQRLQAPTAADIPHVQRMCHQKCATVANEIVAKKAEASELTSQLDAVLNEPPPVTYDPESEMQRLTRLQELGVELTRVESDVRTLVASRRREFTTLLHFDAHVRQLVAAFMKET